MSFGTEMNWLVSGVLSMIMYSPGLVVDCSSESAGRENRSGYSFVVRRVRSGRTRRGLAAWADEDEEELPAGVER